MLQWKYGDGGGGAATTTDGERDVCDGDQREPEEVSRYARDTCKYVAFRIGPRVRVGQQKHKDLVEASFFYSGRGDATFCFCCGVSGWVSTYLTITLGISM